MTENEIPQESIEVVQKIWHEAFEDNWIPSDEYAARMIRFAGDAATVIEAIEACAENERIRFQSYDVRMSYTYGIMKNLRDPNRRKKWQG